MKNSHDIIVSPILTEKGTMLTEKENKYLFKVAINSNKIEIKRAVEAIFKVNVTKVNTVVVAGKEKRVRRELGRTSDYKKAIVTVKQGEKIDLL